MFKKKQFLWDLEQKLLSAKSQWPQLHPIYTDTSLSNTSEPWNKVAQYTFLG